MTVLLAATRPRNSVTDYSSRGGFNLSSAVQLASHCHLILAAAVQVKQPPGSSNATISPAACCCLTMHICEYSAYDPGR